MSRRRAWASRRRHRCTAARRPTHCAIWACYGASSSSALASCTSAATAATARARVGVRMCARVCVCVCARRVERHVTRVSWAVAVWDVCVRGLRRLLRAPAPMPSSDAENLGLLTRLAVAEWGSFAGWRCRRGHMKPASSFASSGVSDAERRRPLSDPQDNGLLRVRLSVA